MIVTRKRLLFLVAGLSAASGVGLALSLRFPEVLLDDPSLAGSLGAARVAAALASLLGLLAAGVMLITLARVLAPERLTLVLGWVGGGCWVVSALLGLVLVPLWANDVTAGVRPVARIVFGCFAVAAPLVLSMWTVVLVRRLGRARAAGLLGALGLLLTAVRSGVWALDAALRARRGGLANRLISATPARRGWSYARCPGSAGSGSRAPRGPRRRPGRAR